MARLPLRWVIFHQFYFQKLCLIYLSCLIIKDKSTSCLIGSSPVLCFYSFLQRFDQEGDVSSNSYSMMKAGGTPGYYNNSGANKTILPFIFPLSSSSLALAASRIGNFIEIIGFILPSSSSLKSTSKSSIIDCLSFR